MSRHMCSSSRPAMPRLRHFSHIQCADIRPEVHALVEVVVYYSCATYDFIVRHDQVPLRDVSPACNAFVDAGEVFCHRYAPLAAKPFCSPAPQSGTFVQVDDAIFVRSHCIHVLVSVRRKVRLFMQAHVKWVHISVICVYGRRRCCDRRCGVRCYPLRGRMLSLSFRLKIYRRQAKNIYL